MKKQWWITIVLIIICVGVTIIILKPTNEENTASSKEEKTASSKASKKEEAIPYFTELDSEQTMNSKGFDIQEFYETEAREGEKYTYKEVFTDSILKLQEDFINLEKYIKDKETLENVREFTATMDPLLIKQNELDHSLRYEEVSIENPSDTYIYYVDSAEIMKEVFDAAKKVMLTLEFDSLQGIIGGERELTEEEFIELYIPHEIAYYLMDYIRLFNHLSERKFEYLEEEYIFEFDFERDAPKLTESLINHIQVLSYEFYDLLEWNTIYYNSTVPEAAYVKADIVYYYQEIVDGVPFDKLYPGLKKK